MKNEEPISLLDDVLVIQGYFGKASKHLPSKETSYSNLSSGQSFHDEKLYDYVIEDGRILSYTENVKTVINLFGYSYDLEASNTLYYDWQKIVIN